MAVATAFAALAAADGARAVAVDNVDPLIGTGSREPSIQRGGGAGATVPGAAVPFGLVQMSPETAPALNAFGAGYAYDDTRIRGFSPTHVSGTGCAAFGDVPILPLARAASAPPTRRPTFSHAGESAAAGAYSVTVGGVRVALTATARVGAMRMTFPRGRAATVLVDAGGSQNGTDRATVRIDPKRGEVVATARSGRFCGAAGNAYDIHVVARFDARPRAWGTWRRATGAPGAEGGPFAVRAGSARASDARRATGRRFVPGGLPAEPIRGARAGAYLRFAPGSTVEVRLGVSLTGVAGARRNLAAEAPARVAFATLRTRARAAWARQLERVDGPPGRVFATALYHALLHPNVIADVDPRRGWEPRSTISGWDVYRTQFPLLSMSYPEQARDVVRTLTRQSCAPRWAIGGRDADVMVGEPGAILLAEALAFRVPGIDRARTLAVARRTLEPPCRSSDGGDSGVLERAIADDAVGRVAGDPALRARAAAAVRGLDLAARDPAAPQGLVEGSAGQYAFGAPFAVDDDPATVARLEQVLRRLDGGPFDPYAGLGNEPSFAIPWIGAAIGRPDLTADAVARAMALFDATPQGLPGNDDAGALSAWYVFAALGRYPLWPGSARLVTR
ncbi:MAG TPA: glycoside hydrolase domain-containing protein [Baekduia sp.]|uniref:glycoside hydrolase domain-containing protein n=1 Tax=Baekduia sp. TaxID=2600305 RepID=UPI002D78061D|nr:glycoside hydrolase domain-containing protein [Baekduia sp.]HET6506517.1 glycoside hydrolase domain-containing protein [Baekduia sp.]